MADKSFVITADFGGTNFDTSQLDPSVLTGSLDKNAAIAERNNALLETLVSDTTGASGSPEDFAKKKGKPGRPKKEVEDEEQESLSRFKSINKLLEHMQSAVIAFNGINGRVTKATAVLRRSVKLLTDAVDSAIASQDKASNVSNPDNPDNPSGKVLKATGKVAKSLIKLSGKVGYAVVAVIAATSAFTILTGAVYVAGKLMSSLAEKMQQIVGEFSALLQVQKAATEVAMIEEQMRSANRVGGELAAIESSNRELKIAMQRLVTNIIDVFGGRFAALLDKATFAVDIINKILEGINFIKEAMLDMFVDAMIALSNLPGMRNLKDWAVEWRHRDSIANAANMTVSSLIEPIGDLGNLGMTKAEAKKLRDGGFLPPDK